MTATLPEKTAQPSATSDRLASSTACGALLGAAASTCCSIGLGAAGAVAFGVNAGFFALDKMSPIGSRPILFFAALLASVGLAWAVSRRRTAGLPDATARAVTRRTVSAAAVASVASYFVIMEVLVPLLFVMGVLHMGQWFMR